MYCEEVMNVKLSCSKALSLGEGKMEDSQVVLS